MKNLRKLKLTHSFPVLLALLLIACQNEIKVNDSVNYVENTLNERIEKDKELIDTTTSRFNLEEREHFAEKGLQYFSPDLEYLVEASFKLDTSSPAFQMTTTTDRKPNYRIYGFLDFKVYDTSCRLTVFQNVDFKDDPEHGKYLFIPFKDNTNEFSTYGGGRYIDILIPDSELVKLDFNKAYNPYCAYADRWSCPLVPFDNHLDVSIFAGEKKYK